MKFLIVGEAHRKNVHGFHLLAKHIGAQVVKTEDRVKWKEDYELVWVAVGTYHSEEFPKAKRILYGPHNFVFPHSPWTLAPHESFSRSIYTCLSEWNKKIYNQVPIRWMPTQILPFPVDIDEFPERPKINEYEYDCLFYFKQRRRGMEPFFRNFLETIGLKYIAIQYGFYKEQEYKDLLQKVKFVFWVGCHESQGFAMEEAMSMNVPLVVYDVKSMHDEHNHLNEPSYLEHQSTLDLSATSCAWWSNQCGLKTQEFEDLESFLLKMKDTWQSYSPREFIVNTLTAEKCWDRIDLAFDTI
jgi:hypothetical protein